MRAALLLRAAEAARVLAPRRRCTLAGPPCLQKVFGRSGTLCRRVACKGRGQVPALPEAGSPLQATTLTASCSSASSVRGRHDGRHSLSRRFTHPCNPLWSPTGGHARRGSARLACARPAVGVRSLRHAPCIHGLLLASLRGRLGPLDADPRSLVDRPAQPRTCTTRPRRKADRVHVVHRPDAQGKGSRRRSSACLAPWPATRWVAEGPAAAAVARALARLRSFLALPGLVVPRSRQMRGPGRNTPQCIEGALSVDPWPGAPIGPKCICLLNAQAEPTAQAMGGHGQPPAR